MTTVSSPMLPAATGLLTRSVDRVRALTGAEGGAALLARAKRRALDPAALDEHEPLFFQAEISSDRIDSYFTVMRPSTLRNFAADAERGVALLEAHDHRQMPLGYSLVGAYVGARGDGVARVEASFFVPRGISAAGDRLIASIRAGLAKDVSVGFYGGTQTCSVCGRDIMRDWGCPHVPGLEYDATDAAGKKTGGRALCVGHIEDARLAEVSSVFSAATPGAGITSLMEAKARREVEAGRLPPTAIRALEQRFRFRLVAPARPWPPAAAYRS